MKIFRFYPKMFTRMYFVASDEDAADQMIEEVYASFMMEQGEFYDPEWDDMEEIRRTFETGFAAKTGKDLAFIDSHY